MASSWGALGPMTEQGRCTTTGRLVLVAFFSKKISLAHFVDVKPCEPSVDGGWAAVEIAGEGLIPDCRITRGEEMKWIGTRRGRAMVARNRVERRFAFLREV